MTHAASHNHDHPDHGSALPKLNRISGQIDGIKRMIEQGRECPDILAQLRAARAALRRVESDILETHLQSCIASALSGGNTETVNRQIQELTTLFKRFDDK